MSVASNLLAAEVATAFGDGFGRLPTGIWRAPGRVNLIGEHTDYADGYVLPLAIGPACYVSAGPAGRTGITRVRSLRHPGAVVAFPATRVAVGQVGGWAAYVAGVFWALRELGHRVPDLDLVIGGDVPVGAGLSSSAALECAVATAVAELGGLDLDRGELARAGHLAENRYVGAPTGIMDQMAAMHGRSGALVFLDVRSGRVRPVPFDPDAAGLVLLVIDTRAPHALVDGAYAERRACCDRAAAALGVPALRDVDAAGLDAALARLDHEATRRRVRHVVTENARVLRVVATLDAGEDLRAIGPDLNGSHDSLRDDFEVTVPQLDVAVDAARSAGAYGARMTGGGFGGSAIALVDREAAAEVEAAVRRAFDARSFEPPEVFAVTPAEGAGRLTGRIVSALL